MDQPIFHSGAYTAAKADYLAAAMDEIDGEIVPGQIAVNVKHARPLHPHGMRMVRDGLMTISRSGIPAGKTSRKSSAKSYTILKITPEGQAELARLQKVAERKMRKRGGTAPAIDYPRSKRKDRLAFKPVSAEIRKARKEAAIRFLKEANKQHTEAK
jgi:hypothetical protein